MNILTSKAEDLSALSLLNEEFIQNFINRDAEAHAKIIHPDFVCIEGSGDIVDRESYLTDWRNAYNNSGYTSFSITDENIRLFGNMALVRSKTIYTKQSNGETIHGNSIYTDTYIKENGRWLCVQAHITPIKK